MSFARKRLPAFGAALAALALPAARPLSAQNLVTNPSFEANVGAVPVGYYNFVGSVPSVAHDALTGANAADFSSSQPFTLLDQGGPLPGAAAITTVIGQTYTFSYNVKGAGTSNPFFGYGNFSATIGAAGGSLSGATNTITSADYTLFTSTYTATSTQTEIQFSASFFTSGNDLYLDDVSLTGPATVTPEPSTLALLGVVLLPAGLLARKRRA